MIEPIINGLKKAIEKQWEYKKHLVQVKPEYLLTVFIADEISKGYGNNTNFHLLINIEEETKRVALHLHMQEHGISFLGRLKNAVTRKGKVDIFIFERLSKRSNIIEIKNFNPSKAEVEKELKRFKDFKSIPCKNTLEYCWLVFPSNNSRKDWLKDILNRYNACFPNPLIREELVKTGNDNEDGISDYWINLIGIKG